MPKEIELPPSTTGPIKVLERLARMVADDFPSLVEPGTMIAGGQTGSSGDSLGNSTVQPVSETFTEPNLTGHDSNRTLSPVEEQKSVSEIPVRK